MTREQAIKEIVEYGINFGGGDYVDIEALKVAVEELSKFKWIVCSERLPEKNGNYLITIKDGVFCVTSIRYFNSRKKKWDLGIERDNPGMEIIAWMPFPEPYKEGD